MRNGNGAQLQTPAATRAPVRCAIYTRKSTEEGLAQEFNSLDAQREASEAFIQSQRSEGWVTLPERYDDGGYTGGNMDRPAMQRLLAEVEAGRVDCVVVYKVDRLSRSLLDFARIMEAFEQHGVSFVSVTQQFNTTTSLGRLTLNILLSFAQFEREIIAERTRDKISAARRKGKWTGGHPVLGYDLAPRGGRLLLNPAEAQRARAIFELYLAHQALIPVVEELNRRGWRTKQWTTRDGKPAGGNVFTKNRLFRMLTNALYIGKVEYHGGLYAGEHEAIIDSATWERVQQTLHRNGRTGGAEVRNRYGALLKGLLHCATCNAGMIHTYTVQRSRRYRYYVCINAQQKGWKTCATKSVSAPAIETAIVEQVRRIGAAPEVLAATLRELRVHASEKADQLRQEEQALSRELRRLNGELVHAASLVGSQPMTDRLADLQDRIATVERRLAEIEKEQQVIEAEAIDEEDVAEALRQFGPVWECLTTREQADLIRAVIERISYDGSTGRVKIAFRAAGIHALCHGGNRE